jgi:predicted O-methyltransferase YrrM
MLKGAFEDKYLEEELYKLIKEYNIDTIIETGTYKGWSTSILAKTGKKVITIEVNPELHSLAKDFNYEHSNIDFYLGSSQEIIDKIIPKKTSDKIIFFLDAHWGEYWPVLDELRIIKEKEIKPVIIIHDFYVPDVNGNPKFGFDRYKNQNLDYNYVKLGMDLIYGNDYVHYCIEESDIGSGVGVFVPKKQ